MKFSESLKKYQQFQSVYKCGKSYANKYLVMYIMENGTGRNRIGISVSKKVGNSSIVVWTLWSWQGRRQPRWGTME